MRGVSALGALLLFMSAVAGAAQDSRLSVPEAVIRATRTVHAPEPERRREAPVGTGGIGASLRDLLEQQYAGGREADLVAIRIVLDGGMPENFRPTLERLGAVFETRWENAVYARVPARQVALLPKMFDTIRRIDAQAVMTAQSLASPAQPFSLSGQLQGLQQAAHGGRGVRIGILDFGFGGYAAAGLPEPMAVKAFSPDGVWGGSTHGTECARLIHQVAPAASLILASVGADGSAGEGQVLAAAQWLADQGAQIVNISASGYIAPLDGSAPLDRLIDRQTARGSTWVVAAGNQALTHWRGSIVDANHDGWVDLGQRGQGDLLVFEVTQPGKVSIVLNWTPWDGHAADLDAFLYSVNTAGRAEMLAQADGVQPSGEVRPVETLQRTLQPGYYLLGIRATRLEHQGVVNVFVSGAARLSPDVATGSVGSPGTAAAALTVGMADGRASARFSSRGPTEDGRAKPEILAPPISHDFVGTSAAAPFVAGLAALLGASHAGLEGQGLAKALRHSTRATQDGSAAWGIVDLNAVQEVLRSGNAVSAAQN